MRASHAQTVRAPALFEQFGPATETFPALTDPCDTSQFPPSDNARANCAADGLPPNFVDARTQFPALSGGGSTALGFESARVRNLGVVFAPPKLGLTLSVDLFEVSMSDTIEGTDAGSILANCYNRPPEERRDCEHIERDPDTGAIVVIDNGLANRGSLETGGIDAQLGYAMNTELGRVQAHLGAVFLGSYEVSGADGVVRSGLGIYDFGVHPEQRFDASLVWNYGMLGLGAHLRYLGSFTECENNDCSLLGDEDSGFEPHSRTVDAYTTASAFAALNIETGLGLSRVVLGVRNIADAKPPFIVNGFLGSSDASSYDYGGRYLYARLVQQF